MAPLLKAGGRRQGRNHLVCTQDNRQAFPALDPPQAIQVTDLCFQHVAIKEQQGIERLRLGGRGDAPYRCEVIDEGHDASRPNGAWMLAAMEMDVSPNPEPIGLLCSTAQMSAAADQGHLVHEPERMRNGGGRFTP